MQKKILVVDDDEHIRYLLEELLESEGFEVDSAVNGHAAVELCKKSNFDLIITDIMMPDMDGLELLMYFRKNNPDMKIIACSGGGRYTDFSGLKTAVFMGALEAISKPFENHEILEKVNKILK